jgi:chorismate mutase
MSATDNILENLRKEIDGADEQLLQVLVDRLNVAKRIGEYKRLNNIPIVQANRWQELLKSRLNTGSAKGLDTSFLLEMFTLIHCESVSVQKKLISKEITLP